MFHLTRILRAQMALGMLAAKPHCFLSWGKVGGSDFPAREFPTGFNGRVSGNPGVSPAQVKIPCQNQSVWPIRKLDALARLGCEGPWSLVTPSRLRMKICK